MGRISWGQSGYVGTSMSENALLAYEEGEKPKSKWTKKAMVTELRECCDANDLVFDEAVAKMKKDDIFERFFEWKSWHHTSKFANETDFYGVDWGELKEAFREMTPTEVAARDAAREAAIAAQEEAQRRLDEERRAIREYENSHGFRPDSVAALMDEYPQVCETRKSLAGNIVVRYPAGSSSHGYSEIALADAPYTSVWGEFSALDPEPFAPKAEKYISTTDDRDPLLRPCALRPPSTAQLRKVDTLLEKHAISLGEAWVARKDAKAADKVITEGLERAVGAPVGFEPKEAPVMETEEPIIGEAQVRV